MGKTITIEDDAYKILYSLKRGPGDSFTKVIRRHVHVPANNNEELLDWINQHPAPQIDRTILAAIKKGRGRASSRRK